MAEKYAVVDRQLVAAEWDGTKRIAIEIDEDMQNGSVVLIGNRVAGEMNLFTVSTPAANTPIEKIGFVASPEVWADERKRNMSDFINIKGTIGNADILEKGNVVAMTKEGFDGEPVVGKFVELQASRKLKVVDTPTEGSTLFGKIIDLYNKKYGIEFGKED